MLCSPRAWGPEEGLPDRQGGDGTHCRADWVRCIYGMIRVTRADLWVWVCNIHSLQLPHAGGCSEVEGGLAVLFCWDLFLGPVQT